MPIKSEKAQAIEPPSLEAAAVIKSRGDAAFVEGSLVFRGASGGMVISELSDGGAKMMERSVVYLPDAANDVLVYKGVAFVACGPQGVVVIDVSDPANPKPVSTLKTFGAALRFDLEGESLLVANGSMGVLLLDVSKPREPAPISVWNSKSYVRHALIKDRAVFVAEDLEGISMLRIGEGGHMELAWRLGTGGQARALRFRENRLVVANGPAGLLLLDVSNPLKPKEVGRLALKDMARDVDFADRKDRVFVANGDDGVVTIDISDPSSPKETTAFVTDKPANRLRSLPNRLYVGNDAAGLLILDVSNPDKPALVFPPAK